MDDREWANEFIAEWLRIKPDLEDDIIYMRDEYMTELEIARAILDAVGAGYAEHAPIWPPPGILRE